MKSSRSGRSLVKVACAIVLLAGCAPRADRHDVAAPAAPSAAPDAAERGRAEEVAKDAAAHAHRTEKAEGKQNLVKDEVKVKPGADGKPVVEQKGEASLYGKGFHGKKTASGKRFDEHGLTAAHPTLPLGTKAKVTNLHTGKSTDVTITDRGPHAKGRDLDLSKGAAKQIGVENGVAPVEIEAAVTPAPERTK